MWHCLECGEQIDDVFDACWKCGTPQDRTPAPNRPQEPDDPDTVGPRAEPESSNEAAEDSLAAPGDAKHGRIVELCSAADLTEAYAFCDWLEEAGIRSRVVGEFLGAAAGSLPLGDTTAPRIWVREEDAARAREIIDERIAQACREPGESTAHEEYAETDAVSEEQNPTLASAARFRWLGHGLTLLGFVSIMSGAVWAAVNWITMHECSETTEGVFVRYEPHYFIYVPPPPEVPLPREPPDFSFWYEAQYAFVVEGKTYYSNYRDSQRAPGRIPIHYAPEHPATNFVGSLTPPWLILISASGIGGFLLLFGFYLRSKRPRAQLVK
jgi:hypothetical protein